MLSAAPAAMNYDETRIPENYDRARSHGTAVLRQWIDLVAAHAAPRANSVIVDLGCGTGRFSALLAESFSAVVIGVDPSAKMLHEARKKSNGGVFYARAAGEAIPLAAGRADLIFASMVFHHFRDPSRVANECRRVLRPGGRMFLRTGSSDQIARYPYVPFFPTAVPLLQQRLPSVKAQRTAFEAAGFTHVVTGVEVQQIASDCREYAEKLEAGADSVLASLPAEEFAAGIAAMRGVTRQRAVTESIDYLVFQRP